LRKLRFHRAGSLDEALALKAEFGARGRLLAGGTDVLVTLREESPSLPQLEVIDITAVEDLRGIRAEGDRIHVGPLATHREIAQSALLLERAPFLSRAAAEVGSPQIRNRGTIGGNLCNAAPCADTAVPLVALGAELTLRSVRGTRTVPLADAIDGPYHTVLSDDEILTAIRFEGVPSGAGSAFLKLGRRRALSIARLSIAVIAAAGNGGRLERVRVAGGALTPTVYRFRSVEDLLLGGAPTPEAVVEAGAELVGEMIRVTGRRWSTPYKERVAPAMLRRALSAALKEPAKAASIRDGATGRRRATGGRLAPGRVSIGRDGAARDHAAPRPEVSTKGLSAGDGEILVHLNVNGRDVEVSVPPEMTLLRCLRERLFLTGTKCGCAVGQCGACTVILDGRAVTSCLILAAQAEGSRVETVEGLAPSVTPSGEGLHPLQKAFLDTDAVACGFCTPGMLMSAKALLDEVPDPSAEEIREAIHGNLCRCTGYIPVFEAITNAARDLRAARAEDGGPGEGMHERL
jgi:xanthine dehydrogenase iron-sulfur cluster and FAD-binding subunit A